MEDAALGIIMRHAQAGAQLRSDFFARHAETLKDAAFLTALRFAHGGKLLLCGNGGSAADCQHVAAEFVNRFLIDRPALPALALTTDTSALTAIGNDSDFEYVFSRQVEAFCHKGDVVFGISTSGNSTNIIRAMEAARKAEALTICLTGEGGGKLAGLCDLLVDVPSSYTPLVQEMHLAAEHLFCHLVDYYLFENVTALAAALKKTAEREG